MSAVLSLRNVCKRFGGVVVADGITLDLKAGEILGLIGPNGAGKTSLFNLISGVFPADSGSISLNGRQLSGLALHERARAGVARTWQHMRLFGSLSVLENLLVAPTDYPGNPCGGWSPPGRPCAAPSSARANGRCASWSAWVWRAWPGRT